MTWAPWTRATSPTPLAPKEAGSITCALQLGRLHEVGGGEAVDGQIGGGGDAAAVLQGGDAAVDGADLRLQRGHAPSMDVTVLPSELKLATKGYLPSDWPLDQQSQLICRVEPLPRMGWQESGVWHSKFRITTGVNWVWTVRKEDGALLASFADGGISLDRDVTVAAASTLNATRARARVNDTLLFGLCIRSCHMFEKKTMDYKMYNPM